jgi:hypothetical protein
MPLILPGNVASATASTGYTVDNSCRFDGSSAYMTRTFGSAGNQKTWTYSTWVKKCKTGGQQTFFGTSVNSSTYDLFSWGSDETLGKNFNGANTATGFFRDPSAWYHVVCGLDTTQGTEADRVKIWVNGVNVVDSLSGTGYPTQDADLTLNSAVRHDMGNGGAHWSSFFVGGYLAETVFIDGQQLDADSFGEFDEDSPTIWKPIDVSGLTPGTNGFYFDYKDSSNLGNDAFGGTDWTATNLDATDQATDTPTNNFCTMNPLANYFPASTFSQGNCKVVTGSSAYTYNIGTFGLTSGKWYWEVKYTAADGDPHNVGHFGISGKGDPTANSHPLGYYSTDYGIHAESGGTITNNNSGTTNSDYDLDIGDILGFGLDLDSGTKTLKFLVNGTDKIDTNISSSPESGFYFPAFGFTYSAGTGTFEANFGGCSGFTVSSGNADANGYGNFEFAPPSGYYALCTKNLAEYG